MATKETRRYRGFKIVPMRQWAGWCAEAYTTRADLPFLAQSTLRTLATRKEAAVAQAKQSIDRILVPSIGATARLGAESALSPRKKSCS